jgi:rhodanese-related sulfurtransferase
LSTQAATSLPEALEETQAPARHDQLPYAGSVAPALARELFCSGQAVLVDVRSAEERAFSGLVEGSLPMPWATGTALTRNPRFVRELEAKVAKHGAKDAVLLLCRSGKRSALAAEAATKAGFGPAFNAQDGFEGEIDAQRHRGGSGGWRFHGLPWVQD